MPGCIRWQLKVLLDRILNPMSQTKAHDSLTLGGTQLFLNLNIIVVVLVVSRQDRTSWLVSSTLRQFPRGDTIPPAIALISDSTPISSWSSSPISLYCYLKQWFLSLTLPEHISALFFCLLSIWCNKCTSFWFNAAFECHHSHFTCINACYSKPNCVCKPQV